MPQMVPEQVTIMRETTHQQAEKPEIGQGRTTLAVKGGVTEK